MPRAIRDDSFDDDEDYLQLVAIQAVEDIKTSATSELSSVFPIRLRSMEHEDGRTEISNAHRLATQYGDLLRYVEEWKNWIRWDGRRWHRDTSGIYVQEIASEVVSDLWIQIARHKPADWLKKQMVTFAYKSNTCNGIASILSLARSKLATRVQCLDRHDHLLNCVNGTLDLKTGVLRAPYPKDFLTKLCPTEYDPEAVCPTWLTFLSQVFANNQELIGYLQRLLGYCLTGEVSEQLLPVLWGEGSNGKSTLVGAVLAVIGDDYSGATPRELFSVSKNDQHPTQIMTLQGKRLASAQETDAGAKLNESMIKHLTGGDKVMARGVFENYSSFPPTHKLLLSTNHKPRVIGTEHAIWRRLKLIEFKVSFEGKNMDSKLPKKLEAEAPGILAWLVQGCLSWQLSGLREPTCVQMATEVYREEQDVLGRFLKDCCDIGEEYSESGAALLKAIREWAQDEGITSASLGRDLPKRGFRSGQFTSGPSKGTRLWRGLRLSRGPHQHTKSLKSLQNKAVEGRGS